MTEPVNPDPTHPDPAGHDFLLSDAERLHALTSLGDHFAAGRLGPSEFHDRSGEVAAARTLSQVEQSFRDLPGGVPLRLVDGRIVQSAIAGGGESVQGSSLSSTRPSTSSTGGSPDHPGVDAELASLRRRGKAVESMHGVVVGLTLVAFLVLQFVVGWDHAWIVWPSLALTLALPRLIMRFDDSDEKTYKQIKNADQKAREARLREANDRIRELGDGRENRA